MQLSGVFSSWQARNVALLKLANALLAATLSTPSTLNVMRIRHPQFGGLLLGIGTIARYWTIQRISVLG